MEEAYERRIRWLGDSLETLREFPAEVRWTFGRALFKAQREMRHRDASPLKGNLRGILEIAEDHMGDAYRVYYTMKCPGWVYVLHCHKKKSKRGIGIPKREDELIQRRFRDCLVECKESEGR